MNVIPTPLQRVKFRGYTVTRRTKAMIEWAEQQAGFNFTLAQGSYNAGGVAASGGTHDKEAVDFSVRGYTDAKRIKMVRALKDAGFAAWHRDPIPGTWGEHVHAVPIKGDLSPSAAAQVLSYDAGRDGLRGNRPDNTYRPSPRVAWSWLRRKPVKR